MAKSDQYEDKPGDKIDTAQQSQTGQVAPSTAQASAPRPPTTVALTVVELEPIDTAAELNKLPRRTIVFPPCTNELLALIDTRVNDHITEYFLEYFKFGQPHNVFGQFTSGSSVQDLSSLLEPVFDPRLFKCLGGTSSSPPNWPTDCCVCVPCVTLDGNRNPPSKRLPTPSTPSLKRLFLGDLVWLFHFERLGIFQTLGVILDAFASRGSIPISNGSLDPGDVRDDVTAVILEVMVRLMKQGLASGTRERASAYRTSLGWNSLPGQKLQLETQINTGFNTQFHRFIFNVLEFYRDKRLAQAIQAAAATAGGVSAATLITISDTLDVLKKRFEAWDYGRNMYHTLNGIVWAIAGMSLIRELRATLGIPPAYSDPHEYIPAAYDLLVAKRPVTHGDANRYVLHRELARNGRDILLDLEVVNHEDKDKGGELERWVTQIEGKVEAYRTAYRSLTGVDLGAKGSPSIEQQA